MTALPAATSKVSVVPPPVDNVKDWVKPILSVPIVTEVVLTVIFVTIVITPLPLYIQKTVNHNLMQFLLVGISTAISLILIIWLIGLSASERLIIKGYLNRSLKGNSLFR